MTQNDDVPPSSQPSLSKGKGKASSSVTPSGPSTTTASSALGRLAKGMGNGVSSAASDIAGLMVSQGKGGSLGAGAGPAGGAGMSYEGMQAAESSRGAGTGPTSSAASANFRSARAGSAGASGASDQAYASFEYGSARSVPTEATRRPWASSTQQRDSLLVGPYGSASQLDEPLHSHAREMREMAWVAAPHLRSGNGAAAGVSSGAGTDAALDEAWETALRSQPAWEETYVPELYDVEYHEAWARTLPAPVFPVAGADEAALERDFGQIHLSSDADAGFMDALLADEAAEAASSTTHRPRHDSHPRPGIVDTEALRILPHWTPPSPSLGPGMTTEQRDLHLELAAQQEPSLAPETGLALAPDAVRADERIAPPPDDALSLSGVHAPTPEEALSGILDAPEEIERKRRERREDAIKAERERARREGGSVDEELIRRLRTWLPRGTMLEDVYGLPPILQQTLLDAYEDAPPAEAESHEDQDRRTRAIRRLEALRGHLDHNGPAAVDTNGPSANDAPRTHPPPVPPRTVGLREMEEFLKGTR